MIRVYCEHGAISRTLKSLKREGKIDLIHFPYDDGGRSRQLTPSATPSKAQWRDMHITWDEATFSWNDARGSDKFEGIRSIIGSDNRRDILHVDSAYKSECKVFVTVDNDDILSNRGQLEALLGIKFFHPKDDESELVSFLHSLL